MELIIVINLNNAVFEDERDAEISRILDHIAREYVISVGSIPDRIFDINGNTVGTIGIQE